MIRDYVWIVNYKDQVTEEEQLRYVSAISVNRAEIRASQAFLQPIENLHVIGGYKSIEDAREVAKVLFPELVEEEIA